MEGHEAPPRLFQGVLWMRRQTQNVDTFDSFGAKLREEP